MNDCDWILCERTSRWAAAMRVAIERDGGAATHAVRVFEVRNHRDLEAELAKLPGALALVEVDRTNVAAVLAWLARAEPRFPQARFVAGLDWSRGADREAGGHGRALDVAQALVEAGAVEVLGSPRECARLFDLAHRHAAARAAESAAAGDEFSPRQRAWASLPWQDA